MDFSIKCNGSATSRNESDRHKERHVASHQLNSIIASTTPNSIKEKTWKGHLRARWFRNKGSLYWDAGIDAIFDDYAIRDWDELSSKYFNTLDILKEEGTLRNSVLSKDGNVMHEWSEVSDLEMSI